MPLPKEWLFQFLTSAAACWAGFIPKASQEGTAADGDYKVRPICQAAQLWLRHQPRSSRQQQQQQAQQTVIFSTPLISLAEQRSRRPQEEADD